MYKQLASGHWYLADSLLRNAALTGSVQSATSILSNIHSRIRADEETQLIFVPWNETAIASWASESADAHFERACLQLDDILRTVLGGSRDCPEVISIRSEDTQPDNGKACKSPAQPALALPTATPTARLMRWLVARGWTDISFIGRGSYGRVFRASSPDGTVRALKWLPTASDHQVSRELQPLQTFAGRPHLPELIDNLFCDSLGSVLVMTYHHGDPISELIQRGGSDLAQPYIQALLQSLAELHDAGWTHGDVKPSNFIYSDATRTGTLIDFGLADRARQPPHIEALPHDPLQNVLVKSRRRRKQTDLTPLALSKVPVRSFDAATRIGTPGYRCPEALMGTAPLTTAADIWAAGLIFLALLSGRSHVWRCESNAENLLEVSNVLLCAIDCPHVSQILKLLGPQDLAVAALQCGKRITQQPLQSRPFAQQHEFDATSSFAERLRGKCAGHVPEAAIDLLQRMLHPSAALRISANDALAHPYFRRASEAAALPPVWPHTIEAIQWPDTTIPRLCIRDLGGELPTLEHVCG